VYRKYDPPLGEAGKRGIGLCHLRENRKRGKKKKGEILKLKPTRQDKGKIGVKNVFKKLAQKREK
jgi:hypothetical protein